MLYIKVCEENGDGYCNVTIEGWKRDDLLVIISGDD